MYQSALVDLTSDPRSGVVTRHNSVHILLEREDFWDLKEALVKKLNLNVNKFYPDAGGIMMGYQGIKVKRSTSELASTSLFHPVYIRAQFFLFQPQVGAELLCIVNSREEGRVSCLAHKVFMVDVINAPKCWETVYVGQTVMVKVEAVEQQAWQEPRIIASLVEVTGNIIIPPLIDFVEELDSGVVDEQNNTNISKSKNDSSMEAASPRGDGWLQPTSRKSKGGLEDSPAQVASSPTSKKPKSSPTVNVDPEPSPSYHTPKYLLESPAAESSAATCKKHKATSQTKTKTSPKKKANNLSQIFPEPAKSKSGDSGHESSDSDEIDNAETYSNSCSSSFSSSEFEDGENNGVFLPEIPSQVKVKKCFLKDIFLDSKQAHKHMRLGHLKMSCQECGYQSSNSRDLNRHLMKHTGEKPFQCDLCAYKSGYKSELRRHSMRIHSAVKPFKCDQCEYAAWEQSYLKQHKEIHSAVKSFKCDVCEFRSEREGYVRKHILTHNGMKSFNCELCEYRSNFVSNLKRHVRTHVQDEPVGLEGVQGGSNEGR